MVFSLHVELIRSSDFMDLFFGNFLPVIANTFVKKKKTIKLTLNKQNFRKYTRLRAECNYGVSGQILFKNKHCM